MQNYIIHIPVNIQQCPIDTVLKIEIMMSKECKYVEYLKYFCNRKIRNYCSIVFNLLQEITDIPDDYLNQSHVLKHLAKEVKTPTPNSRSNSHTRDSGVSENSDSLRSRKLSDDQFTDCGDRSELIDERVR